MAVTKGVRTEDNEFFFFACRHKDVASCSNVPLEIKNEINQYLNNFQNAKFTSQRDFEEPIDYGAYFVGGGSGSDNYRRHELL